MCLCTVQLEVITAPFFRCTTTTVQQIFVKTVFLQKFLQFWIKSNNHFNWSFWMCFIVVVQFTPTNFIRQSISSDKMYFSFTLCDNYLFCPLTESLPFQLIYCTQNSHMQTTNRSDFRDCSQWMKMYWEDYVGKDAMVTIGRLFSLVHFYCFIFEIYSHSSLPPSLSFDIPFLSAIFYSFILVKSSPCLNWNNPCVIISLWYAFCPG